MERICNKKVIMILLLAVVLVITYSITFNTEDVANAEDTVTFASGTGTSEDPYIIETKAQLNAVRNNLSACYKLNADIEFTDADFAENGDFYNDGKGWDPIGTYSTKFTGTFDGDGHTIKNLKCGYSGYSGRAGLFCYSSGEIKRLGMVDCSFEGQDAGSICCENDGNISECYNTGTVKTEESFYAGGIASSNYGTIKDCYNSGNIGKSTSSYNSRTGGIVGFNYSGNSKKGKIISCYNVGSVECAYLSGEIAGDCGENALMENCYYLNYGHKACGNLQNENGVLSLEQAKEQASYAGFDFENVWIIDSGADYWLPTLRNVTNYAEAPQENTTDYAGGYGTYDSPYLIKTTQQLSNIRKNLGASYRLENDIVFDSKLDFSKSYGIFYNETKRWEPIGSEKEPFYGNFDGNNHCISGLIINRTDETYCGLFSYNYGEIKNLQISNFNIRAQYTCGGIAACNYGVITNCSNQGELSITGTDYAVNYGIICGYNAGTISKCFNNSDIYSDDFDNGDSFAFGGIVMRNSSGTISECYNSGNITTTRGGAGGIVYNNDGGTVTNCYNSGTVNAYEYAGGIVARSYNSNTISNCYSIGLAISKSEGTSVGGIIGRRPTNSTVTNSYFLDSSEKYNESIEYGNVCSIGKMMKKSTYKGFDFENVWEFNENSAYKFPTLKVLENYVVAPVENTTDFEGGYGTKSSPYVIKTKVQLNNIRKNLMACYRLDADISFSALDFAEGGAFYNEGKGWEPIGNSSDMFAGSFNGNGHTISGLTIKRDNEVNVGLFGSTCGIIRNLTVKEASISGKSIVGGIVGYSFYGDIKKCKSQGIIISVGTYDYSNIVGGIVGKSYYGEIKNCVNHSTVSVGDLDGTAEAGGIVGYSNLTVIDACSNQGTITCDDGYLGGITGGDYSCTINACFNTGTINGTGYRAHAGGVAGSCYSDVTESYNVGNVISKGYAGGIACTATQKVSNCYNAGSVSVISAGDDDEWSDAYAGGIAATVYNWGPIDTCYNMGSVSANRGYAGGIVGYNSDSDISIKTSYNAGSVSCGSGNAGGIAGAFEGTIKNCFYLDNIDKGVGTGTDQGTSCTSDKLQNAETYGDAFDFEMSEIWAISDTADYKYPILTEVVNPELQYTLSAETRDGVAETPTAKTYGNGKITINATSGQMYVCLTQGKSMSVIPSFSSSEWKKATSSTLTFDGLKEGATYEIYTYVPASGSQKASYVSQALVITLLQPGDPTGDGNINAMDALYLKRALADWNGYVINFSACDVNGDSKVDDADIMCLERHVAGWEGYETLPVTIDIAG